MRVHFEVVPVFDLGGIEEKLNGFLASRRVLSIDRQFIAAGTASAWALCITYLDTAAKDRPSKKGNVDYKEILSPAEFEMFAKLRDLRKRLAEAEGVPVYAVFTNEQLAEMVRRRVTTAAELGAIDGVGPSRVEKFGPSVLDRLKGWSPSVGTGVREARDHEAESDRIA